MKCRFMQHYGIEKECLNSSVLCSCKDDFIYPIENYGYINYVTGIPNGTLGKWFKMPLSDSSGHYLIGDGQGKPFPKSSYTDYHLALGYLVDIDVNVIKNGQVVSQISYKDIYDKLVYYPNSSNNDSYYWNNLTAYTFYECDSLELVLPQDISSRRNDLGSIWTPYSYLLIPIKNIKYFTQFDYSQYVIQYINNPCIKYLDNIIKSEFFKINNIEFSNNIFDRSFIANGKISILRLGDKYIKHDSNEIVMEGNILESREFLQLFFKDVINNYSIGKRLEGGENV